MSALGVSRTDPADTTVSAAPYPSVIIGQLLTNPGAPTVASTLFMDPAAVFDFNVAASVTLNQQQAKRFLLSLTDIPLYLEVNARGFSSGMLNEEAIVPNADQTDINDNYITLRNNTAQVSLESVNRIGTGDLSNEVTLLTRSFTSSRSPLGISEGQVQNAINTSGNISTIRTNTDAMRPQVNSMANDRLIGIRPNTHRGDET